LKQEQEETPDVHQRGEEFADSLTVVLPVEQSHGPVEMIGCLERPFPGGGPVVMQRTGLGKIHDPETLSCYSEAEVDIFAVKKKVLVKSRHAVENILPCHHEGTRHGTNLPLTKW